MRQLLADGGTIQANRWTHLAFAYAPGRCTLEQANALTGPWTKVTNATNPYQTAPLGAATFYRVTQE